jgi:branched-chain amino acid transport system substrate-binding protein
MQDTPKPPRRVPWIPIAVAVVVVIAASTGAFLLLRPAGVRGIVLGAPLATGFLYGAGAQRGLQMAVDEINAAGGVRVGNESLPFQLVVVDTRDLEPGVPVPDALAVVESLITARGADVIIGGPVRSEAALAAMDLVSDHRKVHLLTTGALSPAIHSRLAADYEKYKFTFRITSEAGRLAREARDILTHIRTNYAFNKTYIMVQDVAHAVAIGNGLRTLLTNAGGWEVFPRPGNDVYPTGSTDYSTGLLAAKEAGAQILFIWMDHPETSILMRQWKDLQIPALPVSGINSAMEVPTAWDATEGAVEYVIASPVNTGNSPSAYEPATDFLNAYEARWATEPEGYGVVSSYTAVYVLKDAIERAGSLDPNALIPALEATDYAGPYGRVRFNATHQIIASYDPSEGAVNCWFQWLAGERKQVWPATETFALSAILNPFASSQIRIPPWMPSPP